MKASPPWALRHQSCSCKSNTILKGSLINLSEPRCDSGSEQDVTAPNHWEDSSERGAGQEGAPAVGFCLTQCTESTEAPLGSKLCPQHSSKTQRTDGSRRAPNWDAACTEPARGGEGKTPMHHSKLLPPAVYCRAGCLQSREMRSSRLGARREHSSSPAAAGPQPISICADRRAQHAALWCPFPRLQAPAKLFSKVCSRWLRGAHPYPMCGIQLAAHNHPPAHLQLLLLANTSPSPRQ